jgi:hypothetical protein
MVALKSLYGGHKITASFSNVTERGKGNVERAKGEQNGKEYLRACIV